MGFMAILGVGLLFTAGSVTCGYGIGIRSATAKQQGTCTMLLGIGIMLLTVAVAGVLRYLMGGFAMAGFGIGGGPGGYCLWMAYKKARRRYTAQ